MPRKSVFPIRSSRDAPNCRVREHGSSLSRDEATPNLDVVAERDLLDSLAPFIGTRTTLVVTHRATVAERFGRTVNLDAVRIEMGSAPVPLE